MRKVLIVCDNVERAKFFVRFDEGLAALGYSIDFVCYRYSVQKFLRHNTNSRVIFVSLANEGSAIISDLSAYEGYVKKSLEYVRGSVSLNVALKFCARFHAAISRYIDEKPDFVWMWNGSRIFERTITCLTFDPSSVLYETPRRFFELSNIPETIFVDSQGVNAESKVYGDISRLSTYEINDCDFDSWATKYREQKKMQMVVPQTAASLSLPVEPVLDYAFSKIGRSFSDLSIRTASAGIVGRRFARRILRSHLPYTSLNDFASESYIFLPLQVSSDTQLLLNSEIDNEAALKTALNLARESDSKLVIKIHPAENNFSGLQRVATFIREHKDEVVLSNDNTTAIVNGANIVVTINSSVGLEAMLLGKRVVFLGRSIYEKLDSTLLKNYVMGFLLKVDYFSSGAVVPTGQLNRILGDEF